MKKLLQFLSSITKTQTIKDTLIVTSGMVLSTVFGALSIFLIARFLGPYRFGLYTSTLAIVVIVIDALDLAINSSIINFASKQDSASLSFVNYGFRLKLVLGFLIGLIFALLSRPLAGLLHPEVKTPLLFASLFIPVVFLQRFPRSLLQAKRKFFQDISLEVSTNLFRLVLIIGLYFFFSFTVISALSAYLIGALMTFFIGAFLISWKFLQAKITSTTKHRFFSFQKWLTFGFILAAFHSRIDSAILLRLTDPASTGIYQAAYRFFLPAIQLASALSLIFAPRFASFANQTEARQYLFKAAKLTGLLGSLVLLIIPLAPLFVNLFFGSDYLPAIPLARTLSLGFVFFIAGSPFVSYLIYSVNRLKTFFGLSLFQLILLISLNLILIPRYQALGAAMAASLTLIVLNTLTAFLALKQT